MPSESPSDGICFPKRIILPQAYANPFYRIGNSKKNPFHSHAGKPVFDFGYFWLFRVIYESSFPQKRESRHSMLRQFIEMTETQKTGFPLSWE
ncbi:hypothetical protein [Neisseria meningitidis]|uniref:hypothetical protein n=5 Tax=Neisseria TaxID=482 RepID=UPI001E338361|nr:hypothetical protein [Neisseria meningitidis]